MTFLWDYPWNFNFDQTRGAREIFNSLSIKSIKFYICLHWAIICVIYTPYTQCNARLDCTYSTPVIIKFVSKVLMNTHAMAMSHRPNISPIWTRVITAEVYNLLSTVYTGKWHPGLDVSFFLLGTYALAVQSSLLPYARSLNGLRGATCATNHWRERSEALTWDNTKTPDARLDILARGFYSHEEQALFGVWVSPPGAPSNSVFETSAEMYI